MYLEHWGLKKFPFENVPDPDFFYLSKSHEEGLTRLIYAAKMRKGGAMMSGELGCGKTLLTRVYIKELPRDQFDIGLVINPRLEPLEFLQEVLYQFDITDGSPSKIECLRMLNEKMLENMRQKRETLLIIDEAQLISDSTFEEIRLLLNFQLENRFLITVILVGQPELAGRIKGIEQLNQRIAIKFHLPPFNLEETVQYIAYRLKKAGLKKSIFDSDAVERIFAITKGVPRKINNLCDLSLFTGFSGNKEVINDKIIVDILNDGALF